MYFICYTFKAGAAPHTHDGEDTDRRSAAPHTRGASIFILTFLHPYILTFLHSNILIFLHSYILTFLHSYILTFLHSYIAPLFSK